MSMRNAFGLGVFLLFLAVGQASGAFKNIAVDDKAFDFTLNSISGSSVRLESELGQKALVLVFWASWSPRSAAILDDLESYYQKNSKNGLKVIAVNVEGENLTPETKSVISEMASKYSFIVAYDDGLEAFNSYGVVATPSLAILDETGVIRYERAGYSTSAKLDMYDALNERLGVVQEEGGDSGRIAVKMRSYVPPKKATLRYGKAQVLIKRGQAKKAVRDLEMAAKIDPDWVEPRFLLANVYLFLSKKNSSYLAKAEQTLNSALEINADHAPSLSLLAEISLLEKNFEDALNYSEKALAVDPSYVSAMLIKAGSLRGLGRLDEAYGVVEKAFELEPDNPRVFAERGELAAAKGEYEKAAESFRKAVERALQIIEQEG